MNSISKLLLVLCLFMTVSGMAQTLTQTVRGTITDVDSKIPIIGAKVIIVGSDPLKGSVTDVNGDFRIENVEVGRIQLRITSTGYQEMNIPNLLVESGKESVLNLEMVEDIKTLEKVVVTARKDKSESINKMATVSAKTFSVEETNRYAGSFNDPARMVSGFAGVTGNAEGDNDIVVRGNSPRGILWRLDGIDIPNPNHFAGEGATGGPISALNGSTLANSDFFSGAFAPEYGNALSGVFDVKFRQGNNEQREYTFSAGALGIDGTLEGPFKKGYRGSYMVNYRYSSIALMDRLGILDFGGIPIYQDAAFKLMLPTKKLGTFSIIGFGGISKIDESYQDSLGMTEWKYDFRANMGVLGLKHTYVISPKVYVKSYISGTTSFSGGEGFGLNSDSILFLAEREGFRYNNLRAQSIFNFKPNKKNIFQVGATYTHMHYNLYYQDDYDEDGIMAEYLGSNGATDMMQSFLSWKYRINNDLTLVSGLHHTHFFLNDNYAVEPRLGMKWQMTKRQNLSAGFGMHSRLEAASTYLYNELEEDGSKNYLNRDLDFTKSMHFVLGYGFRPTNNLHVKTEVYYQHLYNVPVLNDSSRALSLINSSGGFPEVALVNEGTGRNYGVELTVERFFSNNFYYLLTGSLYKSQYAGLDGVLRNSRFDANFATNLLLGKEFKFGKKKNNNKTFGINAKVSFLGGNRFTPIDLAASMDAGYTIRQVDAPFSAKGDNVFFINLGLTYRADMKRASHSFKLDFQNLTNHQAVVSEYYNGDTQTIETSTQLSFIPNVVYTIKF